MDLHPVGAMIHKGHLQVILGPMFAGKTTELLRRLRRYALAKKSCLVIKYRKDTRYSEDLLATHDRQMHIATSCERLAEVEEEALKHDCLGIDEGQFYPDLVDFCDKMANMGKIVIVSALDGTFQRKPFNDVLCLIPRAEIVIKLTAVCMVCNEDAHFSKRIVEAGEVEVIGGADKYIAVCRDCFFADEDYCRTRLGTPDVPVTNKSGVCPPSPNMVITPVKNTKPRLFNSSLPSGSSSSSSSPLSPFSSLEDRQQQEC